MSLEFVKVLDQVKRMARHLSKLDQSSLSKLDIALERLETLGCDMEFVHSRIALMRGSSVSGYRGAAHAPGLEHEVVCGLYELPAMPATVTVAAADGSQVYPDLHAPALYYLLNIGVFAYMHGPVDVLPIQMSEPELAFAEKQVLDEDRRPVNNQTVNARRTVREMEWLARAACDLREQAAGPLVCIHDGPLLKYFGNTEISGAREIERAYLTALRKIYDAGAVVVGFTDRSRSAAVISLLHLLGLAEGEINDAILRTNGPMEGLTDVQLFSAFLDTEGGRSAIMTQNSPQNVTYMREAPEFEIAFFYMNMGGTVARIELPMWAAASRDAVNTIQAVLHAQCAIQGRKRYPYALTRADELAVIRAADKAQLEELIRVEMLRTGLAPETSHKLMTKGLARAERQRHRLG